MNTNGIPTEVLETVLDTLKAYSECHVWFEFGAYHASSGIALKHAYSPDRRFVGTFKAKEVFTPEERNANFKAVFGYDRRPPFK